jgi:prevent-host-death family protein
MEIVTIHTAKTTLSQLIARVEAGEEILLARGKQPVAKLVPLQPKASTRKFGALKGAVTVSRNFFDPLPEQELGSLE